jgi:hypothetical protein
MMFLKRIKKWKSENLNKKEFTGKEEFHAYLLYKRYL